MYQTSISLFPPMPVRVAGAPDNGPVGLGQGVLVRTIFGLRPVETLMAGDLLLDQAGQIVELRGMRKQRCRSHDLVQFAADDGRMVLGRATPILSDDWRLQVLHGSAAMVPVRRLLDGRRVQPAKRSLVVHELIFDVATDLTVQGATLRFG